MLARYTHPHNALKAGALESFAMVTNWSQTADQRVKGKGVSEEIQQTLEGKLVDAARIELATSALRTQRSPS